MRTGSSIISYLILGISVSLEHTILLKPQDVACWRWPSSLFFIFVNLTAHGRAENLFLSISTRQLLLFQRNISFFNSNWSTISLGQLLSRPMIRSDYLISLQMSSVTFLTYTFFHLLHQHTGVSSSKITFIYHDRCISKMLLIFPIHHWALNIQSCLSQYLRRIKGFLTFRVWLLRYSIVRRIKPFQLYLVGTFFFWYRPF